MSAHACGCQKVSSGFFLFVLFCFQSFSILSLLVKGLGFFEEINDPTYETLKVKDVFKVPITS